MSYAWDPRATRKHVGRCWQSLLEPFPCIRHFGVSLSSIPSYLDSSLPVKLEVVCSVVRESQLNLMRLLRVRQETEL